jgi:U32 family peptidase
VQPRGAETVLRFGHGDIDFSRIRPGHRVWKTSDPELERRLRQSFEGDRIRFQRPVHLEVHGAAGTPLTLFARDDEGHVARADSATVLAKAENQPLTTERLRSQLGRLGGTPFRLGEFTNALEGDVIAPVSELNELRRRVIAELDAQRAAPKRWTLTELRSAEFGLRNEASANAATEPELIVVVRNLAQLDGALMCDGVETFYCEFENPKHYRDAVQRFRAWQGARSADPHSAVRNPQSSIWIAAPRVFKPGEDWVLKQVLSAEADGYLVRNYDHLAWFAGRRRRGDFSLNVANPLTADHYVNTLGLERVTASYDLNVAQLEALLRSAPGAWFDITLHQHMPMFHMEHCVFCAFLSEGTDYRNCGRPCDRHDVRLRDRVGAEHPLKADAGCRNTVFNARAQTGAEFADRLLALGARSFRIEFLNETADELRRTVARYRQLLRGEIGGAELWRELKLINQLGVTRGQLEAAPQLLRRKS